MAEWMDILDNSKNHGHFAGQSERNQDAYFEFFEGPDQKLLPQCLWLVSIARQWLTRFVPKGRMSRTTFIKELSRKA